MGMIETKINNRYSLMLPEHRAARPEWRTGWEEERIGSMLAEINNGDIVFDIGVEEGDITALIAKYTKCKIVMFEPNKRVWPCIKAIWEGNDLPPPLDFFRGFVSNKTTVDNYQVDASMDNINISDMIPDHGFNQLYENYPTIPQITIDDYCKATGIFPTFITMDVEGAEFNVMQGATLTMKDHKPIIYMSVHGAFMYESYGHHIGDMLKFIHDHGYNHDVIELDYHELHVIFYPK